MGRTLPRVIISTSGDGEISIIDNRTLRPFIRDASIYEFLGERVAINGYQDDVFIVVTESAHTIGLDGKRVKVFSPDGKHPEIHDKWIPADDVILLPV